MRVWNGAFSCPNDICFVPVVSQGRQHVGFQWKPRLTSCSFVGCSGFRESRIEGSGKRWCPLVSTKKRTGIWTPFMSSAQVQTTKETEDKSWLQSVLDCRDVDFGQLGATALQSLRREAEEELTTRLKLPGRKDELWRFTNLRNLFSARFKSSTHRVEKPFLESFFERDVPSQQVVLVDGVFDPSLSNLSNIPDQVFIGSVTKLDEERQRWIYELTKKGETGIKETNIFAAVNLASFRDITVIWIPRDISLPECLHLCCCSTTSSDSSFYGISHPRLAVVVEGGSHVKILQHHFGTSGGYLDNYATSVSVGDSATLEYYVVNECPKDALCLGSLNAQLEQYSTFRFRLLSVGSRVGRLTMTTNFSGRESNALLHGLSVANEDRTLDFHSFIDHSIPSCRSEQLQRNLAADRSQCVFRGLVKIRREARSTCAHQLCRSMLLSNRAQTKTMPMLEIANDEVECSHGATVAEIEEDELFYLLSRGISEWDARVLLVSGFALDLLKEFPFPSIVERTENLIAQVVNDSREDDTKQVDTVEQQEWDMTT
ncbi:hypothetical protein GAYE_PCTG14G0543 [Galdieria yellowstonensis]|uniref:Iron-sulfur cluster assembly SufBD family protein ycf24 n=1 Tax=Galdieria yellowstonensis TaxID=3028027 RepID=A0AAV9I6K4_9RHOD|nr:hypothetical protein GAYE_PCTG14G0543 [Galdieria yellowstonensis]